MDRSGKRYLLRHVWFEEWIVTLRCRLCSASEEGRRSFKLHDIRKVFYDETLTRAGTSLIITMTLRQRLVGQEIQTKANSNEAVRAPK